MGIWLIFGVTDWIVGAKVFTARTTDVEECEISDAFAKGGGKWCWEGDEQKGRACGEGPCDGED